MLAGEKDGAVAGDVKSAPLVVTKADSTYVYFTSNGNPGGVFCVQAGRQERALCTKPKNSGDYNLASAHPRRRTAACTLLNDSGYLFKMKRRLSKGNTLPSQATGKDPPVEKNDNPTPTPKPVPEARSDSQSQAKAKPKPKREQLWQ